MDGMCGLRDRGRGRPEAEPAQQDLLVLSAGGAILCVAPRFGGAIFAYDQGGEPVLMPCDYGNGALGAACFTMIPWVSRIASGSFACEGRTASLVPNLHADPHPAHGLGWTSAWHVAQRAADSVTLVHENTPAGWPWRYTARQTIRLARDCCEIVLAVTNRDDGPMPAALGFHPYFPRPNASRIATQVGARWRLDAAGLPLGLERIAPADAIEVPAEGVDALFAHWSGSARFARPSGGEIEVSATEACRHLIVYGPKGGDFLCVEPVSATADAVHRDGEDTGLIRLAPGKTMSAAMTIRLLP